MNIILAKRKYDEYSFLNGKTIRKIDETAYFPVNGYILAPIQLEQFMKNIDFYMDARPPFNNYPPGSYDVYLIKNRHHPEFFLRLDDAIKDYDIEITYQELLEHLSNVHQKNLYQLEQAQKKVSSQNGFINDNPVDKLSNYHNAVLASFEKLSGMEAYVKKNVAEPRAETFVTRLVEFLK